MNISQEDSGRVQAFKRNLSLEGLLSNLNDLLFCAESKALRSYSAGNVDYPIVFVMGPHRCGTTLFMQWLANSGVVAYPTNLLSRFYGAPLIGAQIQLMLTDPRYNYRNELLELNSQISFESENGKTKGILAPNEFWYFWRRFLPEPARDDYSDTELEQGLDKATLLAEIAGLIDVFDKPFACKGMLFNYNIPFLDNLFKKAIFIQIKRDPLMNIQSALRAREQQLGSRESWYSFKIREYEQLKGLDPISQVAGQVACINRAVDTGIAGLLDQRKMTFSYERFCNDPKSIHEIIVQKLALQGCQVNGEYYGAPQFTPNNILQMSPSDAERAGCVYREFCS